jgi:hypothetical protein
LGGSTQNSNVTVNSSTTAFAFSAGGGVSTRLTHLLGLNLIEADWLHSHLPNGVNNRQNILRVNSGIIFRF